MAAAKVMRSQNLAASSLGLRSVRVAGHPDKLRMVLDFGNNPLPEYEMGGSSGAFLLTLGTTADIEAPTQQTAPPKSPDTVVRVQRIEPSPTGTPTPLPPTVVPTKTSTATATPTPQRPEPTPRLVATATPTVAPSPTVLPTRSPTSPPPTEAPLPSTVQQLQTISFGFEGTERDPILRLTLTQRPTFKTTRKDDRTFRILISNCQLGRNSLSLPFYPPADFSGITMAIASPSGDGVEVIVSVDRGRRVTAVPRGTEILITTSDR